MSNKPDNCERLHKLHDRLVEELRVLKEDLHEEEEEGVNPIMTVNVIKSLQKTLSTITVELEKCPD
ncbi:hypothetical protein [Dictyobacter kobayashii]|uniref:Uncharacterized protein n=1 Tax=Dictyobacter kobayashii TaxID=2014872 RepID=A0A402ASQ6_9CHLR|nr:hypothetical protein [Dictyobacter kobayashii]GCE22127.1 hypothetical protein KDK_59270 [Dictyobacter kobayashii]